MTLDVFQQVFSFAIHSNQINDLKGTQSTLQKTFTTKLTSALPTVGDRWQIAWGPTVWKHEPLEESVPDNSWYIVFHPSLEFEDGSVHPTYVIAIAGTPMQSKYVWAHEDLAVDTVSDFNAWLAHGIQNMPVIVPAEEITTPGVPYIATGTVQATHLLLTVPAPHGSPSAGKTLIDFLSGLDRSASPRIIVTGHSLGGALTPSLALALVSAGIIDAKNTLTYPIAGPTPGNDAFADLFTQTLLPSKLDEASVYKGWNLNLVNRLDVIAQLWCTSESVCPEQNVHNIPYIHGKPSIQAVADHVLKLVSRANQSGVVYKPIPGQYFSGPAAHAVPKTVEEFLPISLMHHLKPYSDEIGVNFPMPDNTHRV